MGLGYIDLQRADAPPSNPSRSTLPTPLSGYPGSQTVFTTSVTHQLHCLWSIMEGFAEATSPAGQVPAHDDFAHGDGATTEEVAHFHLQHCFEYLRQAILCSADLALEGDQTTFPEDFVGSDGWDATHVCRDWDQVRAHLEANRADDDVWIA